MKGYNPESLEARKLRKRIYILNKEIQQLDDTINKAAAALKQEIQERDKALAFLKKYKNKKWGAINVWTRCLSS